MFTINPFSELSGFISPLAMQLYVIAMVLLVVGGTILDMIHKKSAQYFFENAEKAKAAATRSVSSGKKVSIAIQTVAVDVITSGEFCNQRRRVAHLLTMYGFILFAATTAIMIFGTGSGFSFESTFRRKEIPGIALYALTSSSSHYLQLRHSH